MIHQLEIFSSFGPVGEIIFPLLFSVFRYFLIAGTAYFIFYVWKHRDWAKYKIQEKMPSDKHLQHEVFWSVVSRIIIGIVLILITGIEGFSQVYFEIGERGIPYLLVSIVGLIFVHDTYFYWAHWLMHKPLFYKHVHKVHHHSTNPTPLASFSFHPSETLVEIAVIPLFIGFVPLHPIALISLMLFSFFFNVYGHSGYELMPRWWVSNAFTKYLNTSTHHNLHHKEFNYNFGLYFNHWDRIMGTLDPEYNQKFYAIKDKSEGLEEGVLQPL